MIAIADGTTIERAGRALIEATAGPVRIILFGSRARGEGDDRSDFDFLVIKQEVDDRFGEMVRLARILGRLLIAADVVVVSEQQVRKWQSVKGTVIHEAMSEGRVTAESWRARAGAAEGREQIEELTPWAVAARDESSLDVVLDRGAVRGQMEIVRGWARVLLEGG